MYFECSAEQLLSLVQCVIGAVSKKNDRPILTHVLLQVSDGNLSVLASDGELALIAYQSGLLSCDSGSTTVDAKKLLEISRALPKEQSLNFKVIDSKVRIKSQRSQFTLSTLPVADYPAMNIPADEIEFEVNASEWVSLLRCSHFAVAQNDVRFFLKGVLLKINSTQITLVGTDGHRLASASMNLNISPDLSKEVILPKKVVQEILRLFSEKTETEEQISISISKSHISLKTNKFSMQSNLIDGRYPDYSKIIPQKEGDILTIDRDFLKESLQRMFVLTTEKCKGVRFQLRAGTLTMIVLNLEQEMAEEMLAVDYTGKDFDTGFNIAYILDVLNHVPPGDLSFYLNHSNQPVLILSDTQAGSKFVIMPMRL